MSASEYLYVSSALLNNPQLPTVNDALDRQKKTELDSPICQSLIHTCCVAGGEFGRPLLEHIRNSSSAAEMLMDRYRTQLQANGAVWLLYMKMLFVVH